MMNTSNLTYAQRQQEEIKTIKPRTITLQLSDADVKRLSIKSGGVGLTPSELLKSFIGDLVDGTYSNGSDERMYANEWFDRCGFSYCSEKTMLRYLILQDSLEETVETWQQRQEAEGLLADATDEEDRSEYLEDIAFLTGMLECDYQGYQQWNPAAAKPLEDEMKAVMEWRSEYDCIARI